MSDQANDLDTKYLDITKERDHRELLHKVVAYSVNLENNAITAKFINDLIKSSKSDIAPYLSKEKDFIKIFKPAVKKLLNTVDRLDIDKQSEYPATKTYITSLNEFLENRQVNYVRGDVNDYYAQFLGLTRETSKFSEEKTINQTLDDAYQQVRIAWNTYLQLREEHVWWKHYQIQRLQYVVMGRENENPYPFRDSLTDKIISREFSQIDRLGHVGGQGVTYLEIKKVKSWITQLHSYILSMLRNNESITTNNISVRFDDEHHALIVKERKIELPKDKGEHYLVKSIFSSENGDPVSWFDVYELRFGNDPDYLDKTQKRKIYDSVRAINDRIWSATNIEIELFLWENGEIVRNF